MALNGFIEFLDSIIGERKTVYGQDEWHYCCPFCHEKKFKFYVNGKTQWVCYKCGLHGNAITFFNHYYPEMSRQETRQVMEDWSISQFESFVPKNNESLSQIEALSLALTSAQDKSDGEESKSCAPLPQGYKRLVDHFNDPEAFPFFSYLHDRGVTLDQIRDHYIGYVTFGSVMTSGGATLSIRNHVVFLTFNFKGELIYWSTRSIEGNPYIKSFNAPSGKSYYTRAEVIFNLNRAAHTGRIIIQEGIFNALTVGDSGVATFGKMVTGQQIKLLKQCCRHNPDLKIYAFLDPDAKAESLSLVLKLRMASDKVYGVYNNTGKDANELGTTICNQLIDRAILTDTKGLLAYIVKLN